MPWDEKSFASRHNHSLHGEEASHAARIANAILKRTGSERIAIATANKHFERHDDGGGVGSYQGGVGGLQPSDTTSNPLVQGMIQRYASYTPEKLQELASMLGGTPQGQIVQRVLAQKRATSQGTGQTQGAPQAPQAPTVQQQQQPQQQKRGGVTHRDVGGGMSLSTMDPSWSRANWRSADQTGTLGYLHGGTSGRGDAILTTAPAGSYVIPADVVAGLGEGNSLAGASVMQRILATGPGGIPLPQASRHTSFPRPPAAPREAKGGHVPGATQEQTPVALSHGEFVVSPEHVAHWGGGDMAKGHAVFDRFVVEMRKKIIDTMKKLPGPVGSKAKAA